MKKVLVVGSCGAGKSTFARRLHEVTRLKLIHLDSFYHLPNWGQPTDAEWLEIVKDLVQGDEWIMDGNFSGTMELRLQHCDSVIWLDFPRTVCLWRVLKRTITHYNKNRPDMAEGCKERFDWEFIKYVWNFPRVSRPKIRTRLKKFNHFNLFHLKSNEETEKFLQKVSQKNNADS